MRATMRMTFPILDMRSTAMRYLVDGYNLLHATGHLAGKVGPHAGDLDFKHLKRSYGAGLRVHNATSTLVRLDVSRSTEGWRVFFKMTDPFKRSTPASGRSAVVPFVP